MPPPAQITGKESPPHNLTTKPQQQHPTSNPLMKLQDPFFFGYI